MVRVASTMLPLGTAAPAFRLPEPAAGNRLVSLDDFAAAKALVVVFLCNHCPYVKHIRSALAATAKDLQAEGAAVVGISSNDIVSHPDDAPDKMAEEAKAAGYTFPYLYDETQETALAYHASCTPDFYVFDADRRLAYRGQMDGSRPGNDIPPNGADLRAAVAAVLAGQEPDPEQKSSLGCNIKWKPGNEPQWFPRM